MEKILIVLGNKGVEVTFDARYFDEQWEQWNQKLQQLTCLYQGRPEVFFHFYHFNVDQILECLSMIKEQVTISGYTTGKKENRKFEIIHEKLRGGQPLTIFNGALIVGNVETDVTLILKCGDLYVLGTVRGAIVCESDQSRIFCHGMIEARINFAGIWHVSTNRDTLVVYDKTRWNHQLEDA